jgi:hypothetical protein
VTQALRHLVKRPVRTLLLLQGTIWAVGVAVFPSAVIEGTRHAVLTRGASLGADRIAITPDPTARGAGNLERSDVGFLRETLGAEGIEVIAAGALTVVQLYGDQGTEGALVRADVETPRARGLELARGRWLRDDDPPTACVVEARAGRRFAGRDLVEGDELTLTDAEGEAIVLQVVGVTRPQPPVRLRTNDLGFDVTHPMFLKLGRAMFLTVGIPMVEDAWKRSDAIVYTPLTGETAEWIFLRAPPQTVKRAAAEASEALFGRGREPIVLHPLVLPLLLGKDIDRFDAVRLALFLACLVMGAVVMANLGLLTVLRRSHEIAVRRVEGATRGRIAALFLVEGAVLTAVGCVLGGLLGMGLAALRVAVAPVTGFSWIFPWRDAWLALVVAMVIGCAASLLPAWRASRQQPVQGLSEEGR